MHLRRTRRLINLVCCVTVLAAPLCIWFGRQHHQLTVNHALIAAIKQSDAVRVESLLASGANPNTRDTPQTHESLLQQLKHLFRPLPPDLSPMALIIAIEDTTQDSGSRQIALSIVNALLAKGANVNSRDRYEDTAITALFYRESSVESMQILETLLSAGANIESTNSNGYTSLILACLYEWNDGVRMLADHGANIEARDLSGFTPLMTATICNHTDIVRTLLAHGAHVNPRTAGYGTALALAREFRYYDIARMLLAQGAIE